MSELQSENEIIEQDGDLTELVAEGENPSESASDSQSQDENKADGAINQDAVNKRIAQKHYEAQQAKREADELRAKLEKYEAQNAELDIPKRPDPFDDDYDQKLDAYEQAITRRAAFEAKRQVSQQQEEEARQASLREQQAKMQETVQTYTERAKQYGITQEELQQAAGVISAYGMTDDLAMHIVSDESGALITKYLAANPNDVSAMANMNPYQAGVYLETQIKPKAQSLKPRQTSAPVPPTQVEGGGADPDLGKFQFTEGGTFE